MLKPHLISIFLVILSTACAGKRVSGFGPERRNPHTVVHMIHENLHVSISIEKRMNEPSTIDVSIPGPFSFESPPEQPLGSRDVKVNVNLLEQDRFFEGEMKRKRLTNPIFPEGGIRAKLKGWQLEMITLPIGGGAQRPRSTRSLELWNRVA